MSCAVNTSRTLTGARRTGTIRRRTEQHHGIRPSGTVISQCIAGTATGKGRWRGEILHRAGRVIALACGQRTICWTIETGLAVVRLTGRMPGNIAGALRQLNARCASLAAPVDPCHGIGVVRGVKSTRTARAARATRYGRRAHGRIAALMIFCDGITCRVTVTTLQPGLTTADVTTIISLSAGSIHGTVGTIRSAMIGDTRPGITATIAAAAGARASATIVNAGIRHTARRTHAHSRAAADPVARPVRPSCRTITATLARHRSAALHASAIRRKPATRQLTRPDPAARLHRDARAIGTAQRRPWARAFAFLPAVDARPPGTPASIDRLRLLNDEIADIIDVICRWRNVEAPHNRFTALFKIKVRLVMDLFPDGILPHERVKDQRHRGGGDKQILENALALGNSLLDHAD